MLGRRIGCLQLQEPLRSRRIALFILKTTLRSRRIALFILKTTLRSRRITLFILKTALRLRQITLFILKTTLRLRRIASFSLKDPLRSRRIALFNFQDPVWAASRRPTGQNPTVQGWRDTERTHRNPKSPFRSSGSNQFRFAERRSQGSFKKEPPRSTRAWQSAVSTRGFTRTESALG